MKVIVVASQKGGSGKSTIVRNLAVTAGQAGQRVLVIDLDKQGSVTEWWSKRAHSDNPDMVAATAQKLPQELKAAAKNYDLVVIDTPPSDLDWLGDVLKLADLILIPARPSVDDLLSVRATIAKVKDVGTPFAFVLSQTTRTRMVADAIRELARHGRVAPVNIAQRVSYVEAAIMGEGVTEGADSKAADEMKELWAYVEEIAS